MTPEEWSKIVGAPTRVTLNFEKAKADAEAPLAKLKTDATEKAKADVAAKVELPKSPDSKARSATPVQPTPANTITKKASAAPPGTNSNVTGSAPNKTASSSISVNQANCRGAYDRAAVASMNYNNNHPGSEYYRLKYERLYTFGKQCEQAGYTNLRLGASYGTNR